MLCFQNIFSFVFLLIGFYLVFGSLSILISIHPKIIFFVDLMKHIINVKKDV